MERIGPLNDGPRHESNARSPAGRSRSDRPPGRPAAGQGGRFQGLGAEAQPRCVSGKSGLAKAFRYARSAGRPSPSSARTRASRAERSTTTVPRLTSPTSPAASPITRSTAATRCRPGAASQQLGMRKPRPDRRSLPAAHHGGAARAGSPSGVGVLKTVPRALRPADPEIGRGFAPRRRASAFWLPDAGKVVTEPSGAGRGAESPAERILPAQGPARKSRSQPSSA